MLKIGLTGGIGSGKTTVAKMFEDIGIPVYYSDIRAKRLINEEIDLKKNIIKNFGDKSYINGVYNTVYISNIVFKDSNKLAKLNSLVHPIVRSDFENWCLENINSKYILKEAAILFEIGAYKQNDYNILVVADLKNRIERVVNRDAVSENEVKLRMSKQWDDDRKKRLADFIIENNSLEMLNEEVSRLHQKILNLENI